MPPSPRPKPTKKFSFRNLKARFASQIEGLPHVPVHADDISKLYPPKSPNDWNPSQLMDDGYPTPSPSASSRTSFRGDKNLPPVPAFQPSSSSSPPQPIQVHEPLEESSELPWASSPKDSLVEAVHHHETKAVLPTVAIELPRHVETSIVGMTAGNGFTPESLQRIFS